MTHIGPASIMNAAKIESKKCIIESQFPRNSAKSTDCANCDNDFETIATAAIYLVALFI